MSRLVAFAAIQGAYNIVSKADGTFKKAMDKYGPNQPLAFPNTAYYLPIIYSVLGIKVEKLADAEQVITRCKELLPPHIKGSIHVPYLGHTLDAGMAAILAEEVVEAIRYVEDPDYYLPGEDCDVEGGRIWLGAADDTIMRKRGVEFVDGSAPGFAAIVGAAPDAETAKMIAEDYQKKNLYVFMCANQAGTTFTQQLIDAGVQVGWGTRLVPFGPDISAAVFALGFANRAAMAFGGVQPGDFRTVLKYNKDRIFAFVNALGEVNAEWAANAAGAINWGFPTIADTDIPEILPTGICTYEHVVSSVPYDQMTAKSIEVRGLKVSVTEIPIPIAYGPAFEGERVRKDDVYLECGGGRTPCCELVRIADMDAVEDGRVDILGPDIKDIKPGEKRPVVVCQHGLEGVPRDTIEKDIAGYRYYKAFTAELANQGFVTFAPYNLYRGGDRFRSLQRKLNPLRASLFSIISQQHQQILNWLGSLPCVDRSRIGFYGLSYGGKSAMRLPALLEGYALSICSGDFNDWVRKNLSVTFNGSYMFTGEYEIFEFDLGHTFNYAEMAFLIFPRPFMVERGHHDGVGIDPWVAYEYAKVQHVYDELGLAERTEIEYFNGPHEIIGQRSYEFIQKHLAWPK